MKSPAGTAAQETLPRLNAKLTQLSWAYSKSAGGWVISDVGGNVASCKDDKLEKLSCISN
jgi:hypothetical protein